LRANSTLFLIKKGDASRAHKLQTILQNSSVEPNNKGENGSKYMPLIIGGVLAVGLALMVSYL